MSLHLFELDNYPNRIAVSKVDSYIEDGTFFLDFSRPLERYRWFGVENRWFGFTNCLVIPVIHQGQKYGEFMITVYRSDPYFKEIQAFWKAHYPTKNTPPAIEDGALKIAAEFASQFPEGS
jgi:hypothetical protein